MSDPSISHETSSEALLDFDEIKTELRVLLADIDSHSLGSFATSGALPNTVNPGLTVNGLGDVGLPLSVRDASELSRIAHQAPFGKGTETVVDTSVRKTLELNSSQFTLRNPDWQRCVHDLTARVAGELGILRGEKTVRAELYKMLLYEEGSFFDRHRDSEKAEGMFGTLVVALPSMHSGGDVQVSFGDQEKTLNTSSSSDFGSSYLAWYADVEHEVQPIISGYRLVLTYNLISLGESLSATSLGDDHLKLCKLLASWTRSDLSLGTAIDVPGSLAYLLDHQYTEANLQLKRLKGKDRQKAEALRKACDEQNFCVFLAQLELSRNGGCDEDEDGYDYGSSFNGDYHEHFDVYETELQLLKVFEMDGTQIATDVDLDESGIVQEDPFEGETPDDEDYSGPTGNEGVTSTHFYRRTCIVILPRSRKIDFLFESQLKNDTDVEPWANYMLERLAKTPEDANIQIDLESFCDLIITRNLSNSEKAPMGHHYYPWEQPRPVPDRGISAGAMIAMRLRRSNLLERLSQVTRKEFSSSVYEALGKTIAQNGLKEWQKSLENAISHVTKIRGHHNALYHIQRGFNSVEPHKQESDLKLLVRRVWEKLLSNLDSMTEVNAGDVEPLLEMGSTLGKEALLGPISSFVEKHISNVDMVISLLTRLRDNKAIDQAARHEMHRQVHSKLATSFSIQSAFTSVKPTSPETMQPHYQYGYNRNTERSEKPETIRERIDKFATFLAQSFSSGLSSDVFQIIDKITTDVPQMYDFAATLIPFLKATANTALKDDKTGHYANLVRTILGAYVERFVGMEPARPQDWSRPTGGCRTCTNCMYLSNWLVDAQQRQIRFDGIAQPPKKHLEGQLRPDHDCQYEHDKKVSPHGLVITKTQNRWGQEHRDWIRRSKEAVGNIKSIAPELVLKDLLGDLYHPILELSGQRLPANTPQQIPPSREITRVTPKSPAPRSLNAAHIKSQITAGRTNGPSLGRPPLTASHMQNRILPPPQIAGTKRSYAQADFIDLTD